MNHTVAIVLAAVVWVVVIIGANAQDHIQYDGLATIIAIRGEDETVVGQMKHNHSPFASKAECEAEGATDIPHLAAAIAQRHSAIEGKDFKVTFECVPAGQDA